MMTMRFSIELDAASGGDKTYNCLEIFRDAGGNIVFQALGLNNRIEAVGVCQASELARMAEILGDNMGDPTS